MDRFLAILLSIIVMILPANQAVQEIDISSETIISYIESVFSNDTVEIYDDTPLSAASPALGQDSQEAFIVAIIFSLFLGIIIYFFNREER